MVRHISLWWHHTWQRIRRSSGVFRVRGIQLCTSPGVRQIPWHFCIHCEMGILCDLSEFVPTVQVKWSTCLFPVETDPLGVKRKACWSIAGVEAKLSLPLRIKVTFIQTDLQGTGWEQMTIASHCQGIPRNGKEATNGWVTCHVPSVCVFLMSLALFFNPWMVIVLGRRRLAKCSWQQEVASAGQA